LLGSKRTSAYSRDSRSKIYSLNIRVTGYQLRSGERHMIKKFLAVKPHDLTTNIGLLVLRVGVFMPLFIKHGWEKVYPPSFWELATAFPDPAHIGHVHSLIVALISDGICSILLVLGLGTRFAAAYIFMTLAVAWTFTHHFMFLGKGLEPKHGELIVLYIVTSATLALLGPGKFSLDWLLWSKEEAHDAPQPIARAKA
jgi:putative oxidoreductase